MPASKPGLRFLAASPKPAPLDDREKLQAQIDQRKKLRWSQLGFNAMRRGTEARKQRLKKEEAEREAAAA